MALDLRPYQREALCAMFDHWKAGGDHGLVVLPTGAGKSLVIADFCRGMIKIKPRLRIGIVTHVKELIEQNYAEMVSQWRQAPAGIYSASVGRRDRGAQILFMGIQSVHSKSELIGPFDIVLVDEAHLLPRNADTQYLRFFRDQYELNQDIRIYGLTATPYRLDSGRLDQGDDALFRGGVIYDINVGDLIEQKYLSGLIGPGAALDGQINTDGIKHTGGEFNAKALEAASIEGDNVQQAVAEIVRYGVHRRGWILFGTGVAHCGLLVDEVRKHNFTCEMIAGETPKGERSAIIKAFKAQEIRALVGVNVLATGFNARHVDLVAMLRPTESTGLYVQMVGRGLRLSPETGKRDCLILDFSGNIRKHGPIDAIIEPEPPKKRQPKEPKDEAELVEPKSLVCPKCQARSAIGSIICFACGTPFGQASITHDGQAEDIAVLSSQIPGLPDQYGVLQWSFSKHTKLGSPDSVKVKYWYGGDTVQEWVFPEHPRMSAKSVAWWHRHGGLRPAPITAEEFLARRSEIAMPQTIRTKINEQTGFNEIIARTFAPTREHADA